MQLPDLNLLPALDALLRTGSVAGAAGELHVSASAMSRTLGRLRRVVGDPLLVPAGRGLVRTPLAEELAPRVREALTGAVSVLAPPDPGELERVEREFVVRCGDDAAMLLAPALTAAAARDAPGVRLRFVPEGTEDPADLRDRVDLDVGVLQPLPPDVRSRAVSSHVHRALARPQAPVAAGGVLTLAEFVSLPHVAVSRRGRARSVVDERLAEHGLTRTVLATVPAIGTACLLAARTDALALVPDLVAAEIERTMTLRSLAIPLDLPAVEVRMAWHRRLDDDPAHRWLRAAVLATGV